MIPYTCLNKHKWIAIGGKASWLMMNDDGKEPYTQMRITRYLKCLHCCESKEEEQVAHMTLEERLQVPY